MPESHQSSDLWVTENESKSDCSGISLSAVRPYPSTQGLPHLFTPLRVFHITAVQSHLISSTAESLHTSRHITPMPLNRTTATGALPLQNHQDHKQNHRDHLVQQKAPGATSIKTPNKPKPRRTESSLQNRTITRIHQNKPTTCTLQPTALNERSRHWTVSVTRQDERRKPQEGSRRHGVGVIRMGGSV